MLAVTAGSLIFSGCGDNISTVKDGILSNYSKSLTVGKAFDSWSVTQQCLKASWKDIVSDGGEKIVQFTCEIDPNILKQIALLEANKSLQESENKIKENNSDIEKIKNSNKTKEQKESDIAFIKQFDDQIKNSLIYSKKNIEDLKRLNQVQIITQFLIATNGKSINIGYIGTQYSFDDLKKFSLPNPAMLMDIYQNKKTFVYYGVNIYSGRK